MDTIFAPICPLGGSIISVRFSGKNAFDVLDFFGISCEIYNKKDLFFAKLKHNNAILDEVVIKIFREPNSFTGENIVEIDLHASRLILKEFLNLCSKIPSFRFAKNGEFSRRAFLNGKIDLIKSEGINAIIHAETKQQQKLANLMFGGEIYKKYNEIREKLLQILSLVEANIDFSEEEVPRETIEDVKNITNSLISELSECIDDKKAIDRINNGLSIAIIGRPNVGKSTFLNWLAKRDVAIVSPIAGTTRDVLSVDVDIDGYKAVFYDTAGIRESNDEIEQEGVKRAKNVAKNADLCIYMFDEYSNKEEIIQKIDKNDNNSSIFVLNKSDLRTNDIKDDKIIEVSFLKRKNLDKLMDKIKQMLLKQVELRHNPLVFNERHNFLLNHCVEALKSIDFDNMPIEIIGEELRTACDKIGQITGVIYTDDILDRIFSKFCIGK